VFRKDVAKVDRDVAYVANCMLLIFYLFLDVYCKCAYQDVAYVSHMLRVFYLDVAYICNGFQVFSDVFANISDLCFKCFTHVLRVFYLKAANHSSNPGLHEKRLFL